MSEILGGSTSRREVSPLQGEMLKKYEADVNGDDNTDLVVPAGARWLFESAFVSCTHGGGAGGRQILLRTFDEDDVILDAGIQIASSFSSGTKTISVVGPSAECSSTDMGVTTAGDYRGSWGFLLGPGDYMRIRITSGDANDKYYYNVRIREFRE